MVDITMDDGLFSSSNLLAFSALYFNPWLGMDLLEAPDEAGTGVSALKKDDRNPCAWLRLYPAFWFGRPELLQHKSLLNYLPVLSLVH